ncbi:hypothetical protein D3C85_976720 [compost metagenome]
MKNVDEKPGDTVQISVIARRDQRELLKDKARAANMTVAQFVQRLIVSAVVESKPGIAADIQKMNAWLGRINGNINMLSKWANIHKENAFADLILFRLAEIQKEVTEVAQYSADLRAQGYGKRRKARTPVQRGKGDQA